ncbi:hypothetical protein OIU93_18645 [Paeniglutamicibacter sp. ZC-3]|uniref:hypothetical protein n=1 Tax=Paeniglutamicibacter sp. ZC-3 TaxID=2986919 RepID=UPI0021F77E8D|nr:hypothetical protein [Paeniglutamicibacter sp. ZC-3]MCV9996295.1 hypothetical protein [Paeniglutamicibacter sp. ZC-3]
MVDYQAIMSLVFKHRTYEEITASVGCSRRDVSAVKKAIGAAGITAERFASMTAADIEQLFPDGRKAVSQDYADPHFAQVIEEMKHNRFFTLQQGWVKYLGATSERRNTATRNTASCPTASPPPPTWWPRCSTNRARPYSWTGSVRPRRWWTP